MSILPEIIENERTRSPRFSSFLKEFTLNQLFRKCNIQKEKGIPVKEFFQMIFLLAWMVLVRRENQKSQWLAMLSTDLTLSEEEIVTLYGKRWNGGLLQDGEILLETGSGISRKIL